MLDAPQQNHEILDVEGVKKPKENDAVDTRTKISDVETWHGHVSLPAARE